MGKIKLKNIRCFSYHGCLEEESRIGSDYSVDLEVKADLKKSCKSDDLRDTVDYVLLNRIVKEEMSIRSNLLENVCNRILNRVLSESFVNYASVRVSKLNPPIDGDVESVCVKIKKYNKTVV